MAKLVCSGITGIAHTYVCISSGTNVHLYVCTYVGVSVTHTYVHWQPGKESHE